MPRGEEGSSFLLDIISLRALSNQMAVEKAMGYEVVR
jgi:hypothetical protein